LTVQHQRLACRKFITNTAALAHKEQESRPLPQYDKLRDRPIRNTGYVADTYASAWHSVLGTDSFADSITLSINKGGDTYTVGAVTGMIAGRRYDTSTKSIWRHNKQIQSYAYLQAIRVSLIDKK
jgi:ADP-ribosylglycohydrolase